MGEIRVSTGESHVRCVGCGKTLGINLSGRYRRVVSTPETRERLKNDSRLAVMEIQCYNRSCKEKTLIVRAK